MFCSKAKEFEILTGEVRKEAKRSAEMLLFLSLAFRPFLFFVLLRG
jgi:hypothetical protein